MTSPEPGVGELGRRLDKVERDYLPQSLAASFRVTDQAYIARVENEVIDIQNDLAERGKQRANDRRLLFAAILAPLIVSAVLFFLTTFGHTS